MDNRTVYYAPPAPKPATLMILERGKDIRVVPLHGSMSIGRTDRDVHNDIELSSAIASRKHGEFNLIDGFYYYKDNNSLNGTYCNGRKLKKLNSRGSQAVRLSDGDVLRIDKSTLNVPHNEAVEMIFSTAFSEKEKWYRFSIAGMNMLSIGRSPDDTITLNDFMASRSHVLLRLEGPFWIIYDNGSMNGAAVNKRLIKAPVRLKPFDVVRIANTTLIFTGNEIIYNNADLRSGAVFDYSKRNVIMSVNIDEVRAKRPSLISRKKTLLRNIHLDIEYGDFTLVLGGAGAGKSTFIKAITGQKRSTEQVLSVKGSIKFDGMELYENFGMLKHRIGVVPQHPDYRFNDTVINTIMDSAVLQLGSEYSRAEIEQRVNSVISKMMLDDIRDSKLSIISGGQRKRVQVAIKAVGDTNFFTLDEPDAGLDIAGRKDQMNQLKRYASVTREDSLENSMGLKPCSDSGSTILVISHYPDDVAYMYNKVLVLAKSKKDDAGHIAYYGTVPNALRFFNVKKLSEIVMQINYEGGKGLGDMFIEKFEKTRGGM